MACGGGDDFHKKFQSFFIINFFHCFLYLIFSSDFCFIDLKRQSEHSGLRPDTSSLVFFGFHNYKRIPLNVSGIHFVSF